MKKVEKPVIEESATPKHKIFRAEVPKHIITKPSVVSSVPEPRKSPEVISQPSVTERRDTKEAKHADAQAFEPKPVFEESPALELSEGTKEEETKTTQRNKDKIQVFSDDDEEAYDKHLEESRAKVIDHLVSSSLYITLRHFLTI